MWFTSPSCIKKSEKELSKNKKKKEKEDLSQDKINVNSQKLFTLCSETISVPTESLLYPLTDNMVPDRNPCEHTAETELLRLETCSMEKLKLRAVPLGPKDM